MIKVRVNQETLGSDGTLASRAWGAGSVADLNDNQARYMEGLSNGSFASPINKSPPTLNVATIANGGTITCNPNGVWAGDPTIVFTYQWYNNETPEAGKTAATFATVAGDIGKNLKCRVTGTNSLGNSSADSARCIVT